jgi:hypothetical protein
MYEVIVPFEEFSKWQLYKGWLNEPYRITWLDYIHRECTGVSCEWELAFDLMMTGKLVLTFESEQHYHWFLLKVS